MRAGVELITGHDYITGEDVSRWEALANFIPGRRALEKVSPCLGFAKLSKKGLTQGKKGRELTVGVGPYKKVGGHHPIQQAAFEGHPKYNAQDVLAISEERLAQYAKVGENIHRKITTNQRRLQKELLLSGRHNTMQEQVRIAWQAMVEAGVPVNEARQITAQAYWDLKHYGVTQPTRIPWSKK